MRCKEVVQVTEDVLKALLMSPNEQSYIETFKRISILEHCSVSRDLLKKASASRTDGERRSRQRLSVKPEPS